MGRNDLDVDSVCAVLAPELGIHSSSLYFNTAYADLESTHILILKIEDCYTPHVVAYRKIAIPYLANNIAD